MIQIRTTFESDLGLICAVQTVTVDQIRVTYGLKVSENQTNRINGAGDLAPKAFVLSEKSRLEMLTVPVNMT